MSKKTQDWFAIATEEHGFQLMEWPPNSPDLNPIEHLWAHIKTELHRRYPDTKYLKGGPSAVRGILKTRLSEVWWSIEDGVLEQLVESMPGRVQAVLDARGWHTDK